MSTLKKIIDIKSIQFESNEPEVLIKGIINQGKMHYPTDILISQTQLNIIVNELNKKNNNFDFSNELSVETMYDGEKIYTANLSDTINSSFYLNNLLSPKSYIQIRA